MGGILMLVDMGMEEGLMNGKQRGLWLGEIYKMGPNYYLFLKF